MAGERRLDEVRPGQTYRVACDRVGASTAPLPSCVVVRRVGGDLASQTVELLLKRRTNAALRYLLAAGEPLDDVPTLDSASLDCEFRKRLRLPVGVRIEQRCGAATTP